MVLYCNWRSLTYHQRTFVGFYCSPAHRAIGKQSYSPAKEGHGLRQPADRRGTMTPLDLNLQLSSSFVRHFPGWTNMYAVSLLDFGNGIHFRSLDPRHGRLLPRQHVHCRIARSGNWFQPRWHFYQSAYAQARLSALSRCALSMERMAVDRRKALRQAGARRSFGTLFTRITKASNVLQSIPTLRDKS
jgi:hypothetical protein